MATQASWLLDSKTNLARLRQESWLTEAEIAIVDRGIAAIDRFLSELTGNDGNKRCNFAGNAEFT